MRVELRLQTPAAFQLCRRRMARVRLNPACLRGLSGEQA
jgi:hypothetical protein